MGVSPQASLGTYLGSRLSGAGDAAAHKSWQSTVNPSTALHHKPTAQAQPYKQTLKCVWPHPLPYMYREEKQCNAKIQSIPLCSTKCPGARPVALLEEHCKMEGLLG